MPGPRVTVNQGELEGKLATTESGFQYTSYQGIPYAKPPIGDLRFRNPQPADKWEGILDATEVGNACPQYDILIMNKYYGEEDCLFLNVYVPNVPEDHPLLPTMVWIHGGGFIIGDGNFNNYGPDFLIEKNVIIVTINYRLGVFGFLSLNTPEAPGNAGLKDQSLALKWVKENIRHFHGDADNVTIFGESAGAASVHYHVLSPMSKGLFKNAIVQSGSSSCLWALQENPRKVAFKMAEELGLNTDDEDKVVKYLREIPVTQLVMASLSKSFIGNIRLTFVPTVERIFPNAEPFITRSPREILNSGDFVRVPMLVGLVSIEGLIYYTKAFANAADNEAIENKCIPDLDKFVPSELVAKYGENGVDEIKNKIKMQYFPTTDNIFEGLINVFSSYLFVKDVVPLVTLREHERQSPPIYFYKLSYNGSRKLLQKWTDLDYKGAAHADDLAYIFNIRNRGFNEIPATPTDVTVTEQMVQMWTNFAKFGNPTPKTTDIISTIWEPVSPSEVVCLEIDEELRMIPNPFEECIDFWKSINEM